MKVKFTEEGRKKILNFGEQHPDFKAAHREQKRLHPEMYKKLKTFLAHVIIHDGVHEHRDEVLILAVDQNAAEVEAKKLIEDGGEDGECGWFDYGDGETMAALKYVQQIKESEAKILTKYNICHYANKEN